MNLDIATKRIEIVLGEAMATAECDWIAAYATVAAGSFTLGASDGTTNGTTAVVAVTGPVAGQYRQVKEVRLHNNDTVQHQVTLRLNNGGTFRIMETASVAPGGDFLYTPDAPAVVSTGAPAILLESGTTGAKISALPAFDLTPFVPVGTDKSPVLQGGVDVQITLAQQFQLFAAWLDFITTNPFDAALGSGNNGHEVYFQGGAGDTNGSGGGGFLWGGNGAGAGNGGGVNLKGGDSGSSGGAGGVDLVGGNATGGNTDGGAISLSGGGGSGTGVAGPIRLSAFSNVIVSGLPASDPSLASSFWASNGRIVQSGAIITPVASTITSGAAVALTTGTAKDVTTISVPAGNWTITGACYFTGNAATTVTLVQGSVGTAANTLDTTPGQVDTEYLAGTTLTVLGADPALLGFSADVTLGSTTTYRLDAKATFAINTLNAYGTIRAVPRA